MSQLIQKMPMARVNPALIQEVPKEHFQGVEALKLACVFRQAPNKALCQLL